MAAQVKYPIGIQTFSEIRENGYLYVDKTEYIHELVSNGKYYFLSRPRRFGKSLLLSTIESLFRGERDLFKGLAIDSLDWDWQKHEVLHLDLNVKFYEDKTSLVSILDRHLRKWEEKYEIIPRSNDLANRFFDIIIKAYKVSGKGVVILVDEFNKPLPNVINSRELLIEYRKQLQGIYGVMKSMDQYIRFGMIAGVSSYSEVSVYSGLNNLQDISLSNDFNAMCGITEAELKEYFTDSIKKMSDRLKLSVDQLHERLKTYYDGYHFSSKGEDIYNPFSLLSAFSNNKIDSFWHAIDTDTQLLEVLGTEINLIEQLEGCRISEKMLSSIDAFFPNSISFLYQTGYLTIKGYDPEFNIYTLGFPNLEIKKNFCTLIQSSINHKNCP